MADRPSTARSSANRRNSLSCSSLVVIVLFGAARLRDRLCASSGSPAGAVGVDGARAVARRRCSAVGVVLRRRQARPRGVAARRRSTRRTAPQLINVVQEMAIAANVPMPKVYIIDDTAPNAFATGRDPQHASIAITTGLLQKLDREELQGVIGHELSHVRNFDIRFSLLVGVLVGGDRPPRRLLPALHVLGRRRPAVERPRQRRRRRSRRSSSSSRSSSRSSPRSSPGSSSWRSAASASTSPTRRRSS